MFSAPLSFCHGHRSQKNRACSSQPKHCRVPEKPCLLPKESGTRKISVKTPGLSFCTHRETRPMCFGGSGPRCSMWTSFSFLTDAQGVAQCVPKLFHFSRVCLFSSPHLSDISARKRLWGGELSTLRNKDNEDRWRTSTSPHSLPWHCWNC